MEPVRLLGVMCVFALTACADPYDSGSTPTSSGSASSATTVPESETDAGDDESSGGPAALPMTPDECFQEYLGNQGDNCDVTNCGGILSCANPYPDCFTCTQQCFPPACSTDDECQQQYGDLCPGVNWVCDQFLLTTGCTVDFGDGDDSSGVGDDGSSGSGTTGSGGCAAGDPFECVGDDLFDCTTEQTYDCEAECVAAGYSGVASPPCGTGDQGYDNCLCV